MTMANSLELRVPFLDAEVFDAGPHAAAGPARAARRAGDQVRAAAGDGADRPRADPAPPQAGLPGADGGLPRRPAARLGAGIVEESQTDEWLDRAAVGRLLTSLRTADQPSKRVARQVWEILVFMVWHGIFVEGRIKPEIPETVYPVTLRRNANGARPRGGGRFGSALVS